MYKAKKEYRNDTVVIICMELKMSDHYRQAPNNILVSRCVHRNTTIADDTTLHTP